MLSRDSVHAIALLTALTWTVADARAYDETKYPDWSGQWRRIEGGPPRYDMSKPPGHGQQAPLTPEYRALHEQSLKDQATGGQGFDNSYMCIPMGMPRQMSGVFPFEFIVTPKITYILFEMMIQQPRRIYTEDRRWPENQEPTFTGHSIGKWVDTDGDGHYDALEIETRNLRGPRVWDQSGMPMHVDNEAVITERISLDKDNPNVLYDEMTTTDHSLTRPWTAIRNFKRERKVAWTENNCTEGNNHVVIGKENYFRSGDGYLMPARKDQPPPDLRYFKQSQK